MPSFFNIIKAQSGIKLYFIYEKPKKKFLKFGEVIKNEQKNNKIKLDNCPFPIQFLNGVDKKNKLKISRNDLNFNLAWLVIIIEENKAINMLVMPHKILAIGQSNKA